MQRIEESAVGKAASSDKCIGSPKAHIGKLCGKELLHMQKVLNVRDWDEILGYKLSCCFGHL